MSPFFSLLSFLRTGVLFHHDLLVPLGSGWRSGACLLFLSSLVPVLVSLLLSSLFPQERVFYSIMICWFLLVPAGVPVLVSFLLSAFLRKGVLFHHVFLVPLGAGWVLVLVSLLLSSFFPQDRGSVSS